MPKPKDGQAFLKLTETVQFSFSQYLGIGC